MEKTDLLIIGGGLASARAVRSYRQAGGEGTIRLVSADTTVPYHRPPLSKAYLRGEAEIDDTLVEPPSFYADHGVELELGATVGSVRPDSRRAETDRGPLPYERLLIATGARPRRLAVPGGDLEGVHYLRSLADSTAIRRAAGAAGAAVVVGGGFIGLEVTASLRRLGLAVSLVHRGAGLFDAVGAEPLQTQFEALFRQQGVELLLADEITAFHGRSHVESVSTSSGRTLEAGLVVVGVGVEPAVGFLDGSGIVTGDGIEVDERFRTSVQDVYAAGDVASFPDAIAGRRRRIEHWSNANFQGSEVGRILAGGAPGDPRVASFFTEVFGTTVKVFGDTQGREALLWSGSLEAADAIGLFANGDMRLIAAVAVGQGKQVEERITAWIRDGEPLETARKQLGRAGMTRVD